MPVCNCARGKLNQDPQVTTRLSLPGNINSCRIRGKTLQLSRELNGNLNVVG